MEAPLSREYVLLTVDNIPLQWNGSDVLTLNNALFSLLLEAVSKFPDRLW